MTNSWLDPYNCFYKRLFTVIIWVVMNADARAHESAALIKEVNLALRSDNILLQVNRSDVSDGIDFFIEPNYLDVLADGFVTCSKDAAIVPESTEIYFGTFERALYGKTYPVHLKEWNALASRWETKYNPDPQVFKIPLLNISNGHSSLRVDANDLMQKKFLSHLNAGGTLKDFYQDDQEIILSRTITLIAECENQEQRSFGYDTKVVTIVIRYQGDPTFSNSSLIGKQIAHFNKSFLKLTDVSIFQPSLIYSGVCNDDMISPIKFSYTAIGKGTIRFILFEGGKTIVGSEIITHNSQTPIIIDTEILYPLGQQMFHSTDQRSLGEITIKAQVKEARGTQWGEWRDFASEKFVYRCLKK